MACGTAISTYMQHKWRLTNDADCLRAAAAALAVCFTDILPAQLPVDKPALVPHNACEYYIYFPLTCGFALNGIYIGIYIFIRKLATRAFT